MSKHSEKKSLAKIIVIVVLLIILIASLSYIIVYMMQEYIAYQKQLEISQVLDNLIISEEDITEEKTERMLQVEELKKENEDVIGWIEIEGTNINYPVLQGEDNDYYLTHNYKGEKVVGGSIFLDKDYDFSIPSSNLLIYGHRNTSGIMFEDLIKYADEEFYQEHKIIKFTTIEDDSEYEILAVFYSRVYYKSETNVFRYYYFINAETEEEYNEYVANCKKVSIYDTGVTAEYGEQLLTLSTCEYSTENGRFAVVAKKIST